MDRNIKLLCYTPGTNSVIGQSIKLQKTPNKQTHRKRDQICGGQKQGVGEGELDKGGQRVQTSSDKITTRDIIHIMIKTVNAAVCYI